MKNKKLISLLLVLSMFASMFGTALAAPAQPAYASRGEVVSMLLDAADFYNPKVKKSDILRGDENGALNETAPVTRVQALVMLGRAFGTLPQPKGDALRTGNIVGTFSDMPKWAETEIANVLQSGIVAGTGEGKFSPNNNVTAEQMQLFIRRVWALLGTNPRDDFYATVNHDWLQNSTLPAGARSVSSAGEMTTANSEKIKKIILDAANSSPKQGSKEQKIADFYKSIMDETGRKQMGISPLSEYLTALDKATTIDQIMAVREKALKAIGEPINLGFDLIVSVKDSTKYDLVFITFGPSLSKDQYIMDEEGCTAYRNMISKLLQLTGETPVEAAHHALEIFEFEKTLSAAAMPVEHMSDLSKMYNIYTPAQLQALFPSIDIAKLIVSDGFKPTDEICVLDPGLAKAYAAKFSDVNLQKSIAKYELLSQFGSFLSPDVVAIKKDFKEQLYGISGEVSLEDSACLSTEKYLGDYIGQIYVEKYFSAAAKADVTSMVNDFLAVYKQRLNKLDWLSSSTKAAAIKKLDSMSIKIGYPEKWTSVFDNAVIKSPQNGGSYFQNFCAMSRELYKSQAALQTKAVDKSGWDSSAYEVNAFYNPQANEIIFPAGILQAPFYSPTASREENLGGIGWVIAHEITHAFDNNGSKFDEKGNMSNWWQEADYAAFDKKCSEVVDFYDNVEVAPGFENNGTQTLSENIADLGGMACVIECAKKLPAPDYKKLFENTAKCSAMSATRQYMQSLQDLDVHSFNKVRINRVLVNFEEFYKTYNITEKDGMYVAPEKRLSIW